MSLLKNITSDATIADERDSVGTNATLASGLYLATITLAYVTKSDGGATGLVVHAKTDAGKEIRQTMWMTSGTAKGGKNYYEKDGEKNYLPGFIAANALSILTSGKEISQLDIETKLVNVYNKTVKAEVPTKVEVPVDLLHKAILIGLIKQTVDKTVKNDAGIYVPTGETRDENEIDKFFRAEDRMTTAEIKAKSTEANFVNVWSEKWTDKVRDKSGKVAQGTAGAPKASAAGTKKPATSLFA